MIEPGATVPAREQQTRRGQEVVTRVDRAPEARLRPGILIAVGLDHPVDLLIGHLGPRSRPRLAQANARVHAVGDHAEAIAHGVDLSRVCLVAVVEDVVDDARIQLVFVPGQPSPLAVDDAHRGEEHRVAGEGLEPLPITHVLEHLRGGRLCGRPVLDEHVEPAPGQERLRLVSQVRDGRLVEGDPACRRIVEPVGAARQQDSVAPITQAGIAWARPASNSDRG